MNNYPMMRDKLPVRTVELQLADTKNPLFKLMWNDIKKGNGESPNNYAAIEIDANGSDASKLIIFLNIGVSATDYSQYQYSAAAAGVTDPSAVDSSPTHTQVTTLGALIKAINSLGVDANKFTGTDPIGLWAHRLHAPADYTLDTDDFIDLAEERITKNFSDYLYKDASEVLTTAFRLGNPQEVNGKCGRGKIEIVSIQALVDSASETDCVFKMSQDVDELDATKEIELGFTKNVPDGVWSTLHDFSNAPIVQEGPILFEITATVSMVVGAKCLINYKSAEE